MTARVDQRMKRWQEQRWLLDAVIRTVGVEWDQGRIRYMSAPVAPGGVPEFRAAGDRVKRVSDFAREFCGAARKREAKAVAFEEAGRPVAARESYLTASLLWATARWPVFEVDEQLLEMEERMNHCYEKYIEHADRPIEIVRIPFEGKELHAYLHLPHAPAKGEIFPCVVNIPGMDSCKESGVSMYGDAYLERGIAVLSIDGPGQAESVTLGIYVTENNHMEAAKVVYDWLAAHSSIDTERIAVRGSSFGTYWGLQWAAALGDKIKGVGVSGVCHEPGCNTIFNMASPSFKLRYMWMADFEDEDAFDEFCKKIDLRPYAGAITCPVLIMAGEQDQLSPIEFSYEVFDHITAPREIVVYEGANHSVADAPSVANGEAPRTYLADWIADRIAGKPMDSMKTFIDSTGRRIEEPV